MKRTRITIEAWGDTSHSALYALRRLIQLINDNEAGPKDYDVVQRLGTATAKVEQVETPDCDGGQ
jgi:hypothetical protein